MIIKPRALAALAFTAVAGLALAGSAHAECVYPKSPGPVPDGNTATEQELVAGMKALKQYDTDVNAYLSCLDMETSSQIAQAGAEATPEQLQQIKAIQEKKHNAAVDELQAHADDFNKQVRLFKARGKK